MTILFHGQEVEVKITKDYGYEPDTNAHDIEWQFVEDPGEITAEEEIEILEQIFTKINEL